MTTCFGKSCLFHSACLAWALSICECASFPFGFEGGMGDLIVFVPDYCGVVGWCDDPGQTSKAGVSYNLDDSRTNLCLLHL